MKSEKEKMLSGEPYVANGKQLFTERLHARSMLFKINNLPPHQLKERAALFAELFAEVGKNCQIEPPFYCDYGYNISIGKNFFANFNLTILDCAKVVIGDNVLIAPNVGLYTAGHPVHPVPRTNGYEFALPITIGNNVWIGGNAVVNPGISIGENSVIGAGSVVTKNIPPDVVAAGNPCRVLRKITENDKKFPN